MRKLNSLVSLSQEMLTFAHRKKSGLPKGSVVTNGADVNRFSYLDMLVARKSLGLDYTGDILIGVGALVERKGFHHVVDAVINLNEGARKDNPIHYYILGSAGMEGDFEKRLRQKINDYEKRSGRIGEIRLMGNVDNARLPTWYNAATLFCLSSFGEGSPNVLTEALSCGVKVIATNVGAVPDIMARGDNTGLIIPNQKGRDDGGLAWIEAIKSALGENEDHLAREYRYKVMRKYSWEWCAQEALTAIGVDVGDKK